MRMLFGGMLVTVVLAGSLVWAGAMEDVAKYDSCGYCGMHRDRFAHSRMLIRYQDGTEVPLCSLHCAVVDLANHIDKMPDAIQVGDYGTHKLIDAQTATWVLGGDQPPVMSRRAKWAFETPAAANSFVKEHGGEVCDFEAAMKASYSDMYDDTRMIREKRQKMHMMNK